MSFFYLQQILNESHRVTNYKTIAFRNGMVGIGGIITEDKLLQKRVFEGVYSVFFGGGLKSKCQNCYIIFIMLNRKFSSP